MLFWLFFYLSLASPLLPIALGFRNKTLLWWYAVTGFLFDLSSTIVRARYDALHQKIDLSTAENVFFITEFVLVSLYYRPRLFASAAAFYGTLTVALGLYLACLLGRTNSTLNMIGGSAFDFICIVYAIAGFYVLLKNPSHLFLGRSSFFWVNVAFLTYCTGNFLVFLFADYLRKHNESLLVNLWIVHDMLNVVFSLFIALALKIQQKNGPDEC